MTRQDRIKLDRSSLKQNGYSKIKLLHLYDYYNDIKRSTTIYRAKKDGELKLQYFFDKELNPDVIWKQIEESIQDEVISYHNDFKESGIVYNVLVQKELNKSLLLISYHPINGIIKKEAEYNA